MGNLLSQQHLILFELSTILLSEVWNAHKNIFIHLFKCIHPQWEEILTFHIHQDQSLLITFALSTPSPRPPPKEKQQHTDTCGTECITMAWYVYNVSFFRLTVKHHNIWGDGGYFPPFIAHYSSHTQPKCVFLTCMNDRFHGGELCRTSLVWSGFNINAVTVKRVSQVRLWSGSSCHLISSGWVRRLFRVSYSRQELVNAHSAKTHVD